MCDVYNLFNLFFTTLLTWPNDCSNCDRGSVRDETKGFRTEIETGEEFVFRPKNFTYF